MEKELLLYRDLGNGIITSFPNEINLLHNNNASIESPIIVENPSPDGVEEVKVTDIYCDLIAGKEYEFSAEASLPFAKSLDDGVEYYLFKDKSSSTRIGITHLGRTDRTDSIPEMYFDRIVDGNRVTAIFTPLVSGRYYLRLDNNQDNSIAEFYNVSIIEKNYNAQVNLTSFTYNAQRMAATPTITASFNYPRCLDDDWGVDVFAEFNGERYYIRQIPSSSKDNKSVMYKHDITLYSERFVLENIYLYDVLKNDDTNVIIRCDLKDFTEVLNRSFEKSGLKYSVKIDNSVANTEKALEVKDIALDKVYLSVALQEIYNQWGIAYYFNGYDIIVKDCSIHIKDTEALEYGYDKSLLSIKKNNANFRKITRCSGYGSDKNIPFFYPNLSQKGVIDLEPLESNKLLQKSSFVITDMRKFDKQMPLNGKVVYKIEDDRIGLLEKIEKPTTEKFTLHLESSGGRGTYTRDYGKAKVSFVSKTKGRYVTLSFKVSTSEVFDILATEYKNYQILAWATEKKSDLSDWLYAKVIFDNSILKSSGGTDCVTSVVVSSSIDSVKTSGVGGNICTMQRTLDVQITAFLSENDTFLANEKDKYIFDIDCRIKSNDHIAGGTTMIATGRKNVFAKKIDIIGKDSNHKLDFILSDFHVGYSYDKTSFKKGWYLNDMKRIELSDIGVSTNSNPYDGWHNEGFTQVMVSKMPTATNLMPPLYRNTLGNEKFYNAKDNTYLNDNNEYYDFETEWTEVNQNEHIQPFEEIYPTITNIVNADNIPFDEILEVAFDYNDNNEVDEEGNFLHPYFYVKIAQFNGSNGFNLFDHKIVGGNMQVSFTSGDCSACLFDIMVKTRPNANNETYEDVINPIKTKNGALASGDWQQKTAGNFGSEDTTQQNSKTNSIWLALKKDDQTFGTTLPDSIGNVIPKKGDKFVLLNIEMPQQYIDSAEELLRKNIIQYMWENNSDKWNFAIDFSRIFLQENKEFRDVLTENAKVDVKYNNVTYSFYINDYKYEVKANETLPKISIGLADTLSINKGIAQTIASGVMKDVQSQLSDVVYLGDLHNQFLRKRYDETMPNNMTFEKNVEIGNSLFVVNNIKSKEITSYDYSEDNGFKLGFDKNEDSLLVVDRIIARKRIDALEYVIQQIKSQGGIMRQSMGAMECINVETYDTYYRCYFDTKNGSIYNQFEVNDLAQCHRIGLDAKYYWRKVVGIGIDYIDLSISECEPLSDIPSAGDIIVQHGNTTNRDRQSVIEMSTYGDDAPSFTMYSGINDFSVDNKDISGIKYVLSKVFVNEEGEEVSTEEGYPHFFNYGSMHLGSRDKKGDYISYQKNEQGNFEMVINAKTTFKSGTQNISDILASIDNSAITANTNAQNAQNVANQAQEDVDALDASVKPITDAIKGSTEINGGLVSTNVLMVKDANNTIKGGISGVNDNIAFWSGGTYQQAVNGNCNIIIRKDGTAKIGSFIISKDKAQIILADGNYATMSADGIEVTLANGGKATYNSSGVSIVDSNNEEKIKLINGDVSLGYFRKVRDTSYPSIDTISRSTPPSITGEIVEITGNGGHLLGWTTQVAKNTRIYQLKCGRLAFSTTYSSTPSSYYVEYYNIKIVLLKSSNTITNTLLKYAVKVTRDAYYVSEGIEVTKDNYNSLSWSRSETGGSITLNNTTININDVLDNASLGTWNLGISMNRIATTSSGTTSAVVGSTYKLEWFSASAYIKLEEYTPKTLIGTNGFINFNTSNKYFGAYLDSSNEYHIEGRGHVDIQNVVSTTNEEE